MATQTKKPVSRAVVGNTKKSKSSKGSLRFSSRALLFGVVGLLAFSVAAGIGWQQWQDHQLKAKAAGYRTLYSSYNGQIVFKACTPDSGVNYKFVLVNSSPSVIGLGTGGRTISIYPHNSYGPSYPYNVEQVIRNGVILFQYTGYAASSLPAC